ncbi:MAG: hypothetical protein MJZ88_04050 [Paludibacteraceae bacterium]|nr:hypothetical protein [Paludibacteraceae bacterium]
MKHFLLLLFILFSWCAQAENPSGDNGWAARYATRLMFKTAALQAKGHQLEAMDSATLALSIYDKCTMAKNFIYRNWEKTMRSAAAQLVKLSDLDDFYQAQQRLIIYRYLNEINTHMRYCELPLRGPNDRWVWMPEIQYWQGHLDDEMKRVNRLEKLHNGQTENR